MAAKVKFDRGAWWVVTHHQGHRKKKRIGPTKAHKRQAEEIAKKINAALVLGTFSQSPETEAHLPCDEELRKWHSTYSPTLKLSYEVLTGGLIENHLVPYFGSKDLREIRESDLLGFVQKKMDDGLAPKTIRNALSVLRRVYYLAQRERRLDHNPAARIGEAASLAKNRTSRTRSLGRSWQPFRPGRPSRFRCLSAESAFAGRGIS